MTSGGGPLRPGPPVDPQEVGPYRVEGVIARGGMGSVFRAVRKDAPPGAPRVALKLILAGRGASSDQRRRFEREVAAMRALEHPGVVRVLDAGVHGDVPWYAMELVDGPSLTRATAGLDLRQRVEVAAQVARAVAHAHAQGYVHRDLKPDNVLLERGAAGLVARVTDFGLAKRVGGESRLTAEGAVVGTPHYMAPEQATGEVDRIGPATDVFSLGVMLYQLATGRLPFEGKTALELMAAIVEGPAERFESSVASEAVELEGPRDLLQALEGVTLHALEKRPEDRYPTAAELAQDLERVLAGEPALARRSSAASRLLRRASQRPVRAALLLAAPLVVVLGFAALALALRVQRANERAREVAAARRQEHTDALRALERALGPSAGAALLASALDEVDRLGALVEDAPADDPALRRRAVLRLCELALADETFDGAAAALARVEREGPALLAAGQRADALLVTGQLRVRAGQPLDALAAELRALDPGRADLLDAAAALARARQGDPSALEGALEGALEAATRAARAPGLAPAAHALRADVLARLGRDDDARAALRDAGGGPAAQRRYAAALLERASGEGAPDRDALDAAWAILSKLVHDAPPEPQLARRLLALSRITGHATEAWELLDAAARRPGQSRDEPHALRGLAARARVALAPPDDLADAVLARLEEAGATGDGALLAADVQGARGADDPYAALARGAPGDLQRTARAARARWLAGRDAAAARAELEGLPLDAPADVAPDPLAARRLRDAGWALHALGESARAAALARAALRGLPFDLDALALLARVDAREVPRLHAALRLEAGELDGPLGRGLVLARAAVSFERPALAAEAAALLEARLVGDPGVWPAALFRARARGEPAPADDPLPWLDGLALVVEPPPRSAEDRAEAQRLAAAPGSGDIVVDADLHRRAAALDPLCARARWEVAVSRNRVEAGSIDAMLEWARYARVKPNVALRFVQRMRDTWRAVGASSPRIDVARALELGPDEPMHHLPDVVDRYLGVLYPHAERPAWTRTRSPLDVRRQLDALVLRDARLVGFLVVRAHLSELLGRPLEADRDLDLLDRAFGDSTDAAGKRSDAFWVVLQRAAVCAAGRKRDAVAALARLPRPLPHDSSDGDDLDRWLRQDPVFDAVRDHLEFRDFLARWR